ncbi:hypothetical protein [Lysobacter gummosus]|uniref:hypothetical protein n=1 Tax=Lysobacter gummosus TaxID=262324 RepID=UPI003628A84D
MMFPSPACGRGCPTGRMRARELSVATQVATSRALTPTPPRLKRIAFERSWAREPVARKQRPSPRARRKSP